MFWKLGLKKWVLSLGIICLITGMAYAGGDQNGWTLEECIQWALENHPKLVLGKYDYEEAGLEWQRIQLEDPTRIAKKEKEQAKQAVIEAEKELEKLKIDLILDLQSRYYQVLRSVQTLRGRERSLEWIKKQAQIVQVKYESGLVPEKEWLAIQEKLAQSQEDLERTAFHLETSQMELNLAMGRELEPLLTLADEKFVLNLVEISLEESLQSALATDQGLIQLKKAVTRAEEELALAKDVQLATVEVQKREHALRKARYALHQGRNQLILRIRGAYQGLVSQEKQVEKGVSDLEKAKNELKVLQIKYDAGMISLLELLDGQSRLEDAETQWIQTIYDYNLTINNYLQSIGKLDFVQQYLPAKDQE